MNNQPTCLGCFVNPVETYSFDAYPELKKSYAKQLITEKVGLTDKEKECLGHLAKAWELFNEMQEKHPQDDSEFCTAIHDAQKMLALRVARRVDKDVWVQYD